MGCRNKGETAMRAQVPPATEEPRPLAVSAQILAPMLAVSLRTIRTMDAAGKLPRPVKLNGHCVRWIVAELEAWLNAGAPDRATWELVKKEHER